MLWEYLHILKKRAIWIVLFAAAVIGLTYYGLTRVHKRYQSVCLIRIVQLETATSLANPETAVIDKLSLIETHKNLLKNRDVLSRLLDALPYLQNEVLAAGRPGIQFPNRGIYRELAIIRLQALIGLEAVKFTDLMQVSVLSTNKKHVAEIANTLIQVYQDWLNVKNQKYYEEMSGFLKQQLDEAQVKLTAAAEAIRQFSKQNGIVSATEEIKAHLDMVNNLQVTLIETESKISYYQAIVKKISDQPDTAYNYLGLSDNEGIKDLGRNYDQVTYELKLSKNYLQPKHPQYVNGLKKQAAIRQQIYQRLVNLFRAKVMELEFERKKAQSELDKYRAALDQMKIKKEQVDGLERQYKTYETNYLHLLNQYSESELLRAKKSLVEVMVISRAVEPLRHQYPRRTRTMMIAGLFAVLLAVVGAIAYEKYLQISRRGKV
jgi:uncharacterized protein involved in exopolysaccharide biosynthesis